MNKADLFIIEDGEESKVCLWPYFPFRSRSSVTIQGGFKCKCHTWLYSSLMLEHNNLNKHNSKTTQGQRVPPGYVTKASSYYPPLIKEMVPLKLLSPPPGLRFSATICQVLSAPGQKATKSITFITNCWTVLFFSLKWLVSGFYSSFWDDTHSHTHQRKRTDCHFSFRVMALESTGSGAALWFIDSALNTVTEPQCELKRKVLLGLDPMTQPSGTTSCSDVEPQWFWHKFITWYS